MVFITEAAATDLHDELRRQGAECGRDGYMTDAGRLYEQAELIENAILAARPDTGVELDDAAQSIAREWGFIG